MILAYEEPFVLVVQSCVDMTQSTPKVKPCWYLDGKDVLARGEVLPRSVQAALEGQSSRFLTRIGNDAGFKEDWMPTAARQYCSQFLSPAGAGVLLSPPPLRTDEREALSQPGSRQRQFTEFALGELLPPGAGNRWAKPTGSDHVLVFYGFGGEWGLLMCENWPVDIQKVSLESCKLFGRSKKKEGDRFVLAIIRGRRQDQDRPCVALYAPTWIGSDGSKQHDMCTDQDWKRTSHPYPQPAGPGRK